jgi:hypothetical protein
MDSEKMVEQPEIPPVEVESPTEEVTSMEDSSEKEMDSVLLELDGDPDPDDPDYVEEGSTESVAIDESGDESPDDSPRPSGDIDEALGILRRDGWSAKDLEGFDDERLITIAAHRRKSQGDVDRLLREAREAPNEAAQTEPDDGLTAEPTSDTPVNAAINEAHNKYAEYLGLDESGRDLMVESQRAALGPMESIINEQREAIEGMQSRMLYLDLEGARSSLVERFPQVGDTNSDRWGNVLDRMGDLYGDGADGDTASVMEEAILMEFREDLKGEAQAATKTLSNYRANGQPDVRAGRAEATSPISSDERDDAVLRMLESSAPDRIERARAIGQQQI